MVEVYPPPQPKCSTSNLEVGDYILFKKKNAKPFQKKKRKTTYW